MTFLHPWALGIGAAAIALPVVVHWMTKPRPVTLPLSTIRFVRQMVQQKRARFRLRDFLVLLLRAAAVILLAWAFARPLTGAKPLVAPGDAGSAIRVVLLDASSSTGAVTGGTTAFERARSAAANYLGYQSGLRASLVVAAAKPSAPFAQPSTNLGALREALAAAQVKPQRLDVQAAIDTAARCFAGATEGQRLELVILSDFQRSNWTTADFSAVPKGTQIQFESVASAKTPENLAILRVAVEGRLQVGREARLAVDVGNYSTTPRQVRVNVLLADDPYTVEGLCPAGVKTTLTTSVRLPVAGWVGGVAKLADVNDALASDDGRPFVLGVRAAPVYGLITREARRPHASSSHFVERALVPHKPREDAQEASASAERVVRLDPEKLDVEALSAASVLVLDHPGKLTQESINTLAGLMRRGRSVLYVASDSIDATNLRLLADAAGTDLKMPVEFSPPPAGDERRDLFLVDWKTDQPPFVELGENAPALLGPLRFAGALASRPIDGGLLDDVVATYSDRSAALVVTRCGAGTLAVLNADLARSTLVSSPAFVPVLGELAGRLLTSRSTAESIASGELLSVALPPEAGSAAGLTVSAPANLANAEHGSFSDSGGLSMWKWDEAGPPGVYVVNRGASDVFAVASAIPAVESDLQAIDPVVLQKRLVGAHTASFQSAGDAPPDNDAWAWALMACAGCMVCEMAVLKAFKT